MHREGNFHPLCSASARTQPGTAPCQTGTETAGWWHCADPLGGRRPSQGPREDQGSTPHRRRLPKGLARPLPQPGPLTASPSVPQPTAELPAPGLWLPHSLLPAQPHPPLQPSLTPLPHPGQSLPRDLAHRPTVFSASPWPICHRKWATSVQGPGRGWEAPPALMDHPGRQAGVPTSPSLLIWKGAKVGRVLCPSTHEQVEAGALCLWALALRTRTAPAPARGHPFTPAAQAPGAQHPHLVSGSQPASYSPFPAGTAQCYSSLHI